MPEIVYEVNLGNIDRVLSKIIDEIPSKALHETFIKGIEIITEELLKTVPRESHGLAYSIQAEPKYRLGDVDADIGSTKKVDGWDLGLILERGSIGGQIITPRVAKYLRFFWKKTGKWHFARRVRRGTITPRWWVTQAWINCQEPIKSMIIETWLRSLELWRKI